MDVICDHSSRGKEQEKLSLKAKALCKFANLFNNPTYRICDRGFDGLQVSLRAVGFELLMVST